ncbi:MAG: porin family protein [Acidobacteria bacterium]|nr:porin family protein [Acidobacteriota bacterium]MCA1651186.1 porin family protein [Acidobacteriota bacterium]
MAHFRRTAAQRVLGHPGQQEKTFEDDESGYPGLWPVHVRGARRVRANDVDGGAFLDISGGYKVWRNLAVAIGFSRMKSDSDVTFTAAIPDPVVTDRPRSVSGSAAAADHKEHAFHFMGVWMVPVTDKIDVGVSAGPTIFQVSQDVPSAITVSEPGPTVTGTTLTSVDKTTLGLNFGVDVTYLVTPDIGAGLLARYTWGSADLQGATDKLTVGGFQIGVGVRYRF